MRQIPLWKILLIAVVTSWSLLYSLPTIMRGTPSWWPSWFPDRVINLGLDLQGGLYLLLHVETDKAVEQSAENLVDEVRGVLRKEKIRFRVVERMGQNNVAIHLSESKETERARQLLLKEIPNVAWPDAKETGDLSPGELRIAMKNQEAADIRRFAVEQSIQTIRSRIDQFGVSEPTIQRQGEDRILIQLPGLQDPARAKALIGRTAKLDFKLLDEKGDLAAAINGHIPADDLLLYGQALASQSGTKKDKPQPYLVKKRTVLSGDLLSDARVNFDQYNEPYVSITFNRVGARKFGELTGEHVGQRMAIVLDNQVYSAPVIREKIDGGRAQISGSFTSEDAHDLAIILRAGALPAPVVIMEERTVGPSLGSDSINDGVTSCLLGSFLVILFMGIYYRGFGWMANLAVILNVIILLAVMVGIHATMTLPGIAGMVLLVGMSVDANVLIDERIREELRLGKSPLAAIDHGYDRAFVTILDAHVTTLITGLVLYQFGTGPVRGFAVTLSIGLLASLFTAVFVTRVLISLILRNRQPKSLSI